MVEPSYPALTRVSIEESKELLNRLSIPELLDLFETHALDEPTLVFQALSEEKRVALFTYFSFDLQRETLSRLPAESVASLLNALAPDDRTQLLERLPESVTQQLLKYLSPTERKLTIKLLGYPEDSVGRLMTPDFIAIGLDWSVKEVLDTVREKGRDSETINVIYAVDKEGKLIDDFRLRQFLFAPLDMKAEELSDHHFLALKVNDTEETAIAAFNKYGRLALPVVDKQGVMLGIVTIDDIMNITVDRDTEDIHMIGGSSALREPYLKLPIFYLIRKRASWLILLFLGELLTASAMGFFQDEISRAVVLALFLPLIISSGGNAGTQASTLVIRALVLGELKLRDWWRVLRREIFSGFFLGLILGVVGFLRISLWSAFSTLYGPHWLLIAFTVFASLIAVVLWGALAGALLPLILKRCKIDPAVASAPFVATLVDVTGIVLYFTVALGILHGTLL